MKKFTSFEKLGKTIEIEVCGEWAYAKCEGKEVECYPRNIQDKWVYMIPVEEKEFRAIFGHKVNHNLCLTDDSAEEMFNHILEEKKAALKEKEEAAQREREEVENGTIELVLEEGEILTGYRAKSFMANKMLEEIGAAEDVAGFGTKVNKDVVEALGTSFTSAQKKKYMDNKIAKIDEKIEYFKEEKAQEEARKFEQAKVENKPVLLERYNTNCNDPKEECDIDIIHVYAMPDGSKKMERKHTW